MKKWIAVMLALILLLSIGALPAQAAKGKKDEPEASAVQEAQTEPTETALQEAQTEQTETSVQETQTEQTETTEPELQTEPTETAEPELQTEPTESEEQAKPAAPIEAVLVAPELVKKPLYDSRSPAASALAADTVTIDADTFTVTAASGTEMTVTVPFGAYCITQDVSQQLDMYMRLYSDISAALKYYVSNGIHMDILDVCTGASTYIAESDDTLAGLVGDLNALDGAKSRKIADYMSKQWYAGTSAVLKTVGENQYIAFDLSKDYGFVVYNHFTNGKLIEIYTFCESGAQGMKRLESMIEELTFGPAEAAPEASK